MKFTTLAVTIGVLALSGCASHYGTKEKFELTDNKIAQMDSRDSKIEESVNQAKDRITQLDARDVKIEDSVNQVRQALTREIVLVEVSLKKEIAQGDESLKQQIAQVDESLKKEIAQVDESLKKEIARVDESHVKDVAKLDEDIKETMRIAKGKFAYVSRPKVTTIHFDIGSTQISSPDHRLLVDLAKALVLENKNVFVEIRGYADASGSKKVNESLALNRAESVRHILSENGVPLHRMAVIGLPQSSTDGSYSKGDLARDRRVTITVVE